MESHTPSSELVRGSGEVASYFLLRRWKWDMQIPGGCLYQFGPQRRGYDWRSKFWNHLYVSKWNCLLNDNVSREESCNLWALKREAREVTGCWDGHQQGSATVGWGRKYFRQVEGGRLGQLMHINADKLSYSLTVNQDHISVTYKKMCLHSHGVTIWVWAGKRTAMILGT